MSPRTHSSAKHTAAAAALRSQRELQQIAATVLRLAKALGVPETEVHLEETNQALTRFANNTIHQHVAEHGLVVSLRTACDGRTARITTNRVDEDALRAAIDDCLSLASHQPKDSQLLPMPGKQKYRAVRHFHASTAALTAEDRARAVKAACQFAEKRGQVAAGIFSSGQSQTVLVSSRGVSATYCQTHATFSVTMQQGSAASWAKGNAGDVRQFDPLELTKIASDKAACAENPVELAPGKFTVILEPAAVLDLVGFLFYDFSATAVADKRSCFANRVGKPLLGKNVTITDDVYHPDQLGTPFDGEGMPRQRVNLVEGGVVKNLVYARQTAQKTGEAPTGHGFPLPNEIGEAPMNIVMEGGRSSLDDMVRCTERGLLVTRVWYIREVDPFQKILTGMTRDGTFWIEDGRLRYGVKNFRFNQSIIEMLKHVELMSPPQRTAGEETFEMVIPAMKISEFNLTSTTKF